MSLRTSFSGKKYLVASLLLSMALVMIAPAVSASPDCSRETVKRVTASAEDALTLYFDRHPGANDVITEAYVQPEDVGAASIRAYFAAHPEEEQEIQAILAPIDEKRQECRTAG